MRLIPGKVDRGQDIKGKITKGLRIKIFSAQACEWLIRCLIGPYTETPRYRRIEARRGNKRTSQA